MKKLMFLLLFLFSLQGVFGQSGENKSQEIPVVEKTNPEGQKKGISISSAARRRGVVNQKIGKANEGASEKSKANPGTTISSEARSKRPAGVGKPAGAGKPSITVPAARPTPPVVRPVTPRPNTPGPKGTPRIPGKPGGM